MSQFYADREPYDSREAWALEAALSDGTISRRIVAFLLDGVFVLLATGFLWLVCLIFGLLTFGLGWALFGVLPFVAPGYNWFWLSALAATPGQAIMGLTVRDQDDLGRPGVLAALAWTVGFYASLTIGGGLPLLLAFFNPRRRTAHDMLAGLVVVRSRALTGWLGHGNISSGGPPPA
jgi:uncharacterized RDD family membrane protein YckC